MKAITQEQVLCTQCHVQAQTTARKVRIMEHSVLFIHIKLMMHEI